MNAAGTGRPVVVGVERGEEGRAATLWAAEQAVRRGLPLRVIHALDWPAGAPRPQFSVAAGTAARHRETERVHATSWATQVYRDPDLARPMYGWGDRFHAAATEVVEEARALALEQHPHLEATAALLDGTPATVLIRESADAAMLVLGSRHQSSLSEALTTGSIAVPVSAHAACPVAIVRGPEHRAVDGPTVVVGVDASERSLPAVDFAFDEASRRGAVLTAVHMVHSVGGRMSDDTVKEARIRLAEFLDGHRARYPDVVVRPQIRPGHPVKELVDASRHALAVVVGTRGLGGFRGMLLGSVSHGLVHRAACPVVVVPSPDTTAD
ncbi:universal stress protein [Yinghuangia seranimata]|uniref:universal stress protein n=1 Tax=Yinghuangia seranimata TaxID=408067 RepID=UPI00248CB64F|nr:universal stress protein [Yinghuangia seranimata]MDI2124801.1 universal stress protein [Yinghuangia seranimata]